MNISDHYQRLADLLVNHSCQLQKGEVVYVQSTEADPRFVEFLVEAITKVGAIPLLSLGLGTVSRTLIQNLSEEGFKLMGELEKQRMQKAQAYIGIRGGDNASELSDVDQSQIQLYREYVMEPVHMQIRVPKTKWVILRWPAAGMAQAAQTSTRGFEQFFFDVCTLDYGKMAEASKPLQALMEKTDKVHILGPGDTDLRFSIKDIPVIPCFGERNIPDGECFTAPVKDSVEGVIHYNTPTIYEGVTYQNIRLEFKAGKVISAQSDVNQDRIESVFDTDEGARYVGEFSLGFNPYILHPMKDILFDEKISGSMHFTPGQAYEIADNGNRSKIHWDLVLIQRPEYGGGEIWFDDVLIRKDGLFVIDELKGLNPEALKGN